MRTILTVVAASALMALSVPASAQQAGAPGAVGVSGSLIGSNPGSGFVENGPPGGRFNPGPGPSRVYSGNVAAPGNWAPRPYWGGPYDWRPLPKYAETARTYYWPGPMGWDQFGPGPL
jgi:hypothetical protein